MIKLKRAHFLTALLMGVLFPAFLGAAELPTYQKYEGPIKPGVVITKENFDAYLPELQKLLPPSKIKWLSMGVKEGLVTMPIVKTTYSAHQGSIGGYQEICRHCPDRNRQ